MEIEVNIETKQPNVLSNQEILENNNENNEINNDVNENHENISELENIEKENE